jgi:opacity protein-like surface antigen
MENKLKIGIILSTFFLAATVCCAGNMHGSHSEAMRDGGFLGIGGNFNSINVTQNSWGEGISNIQTSTGANSNGIAQGSGAPFNNISNTLSPGLQVGYLKHIANTPNLFGVKFYYQYLGSTATNPNLYIPQLGSTTSAVTGATSPLYGYVNADSVQVTTNHQVSLLAFMGRSYGNASFYIGAGPSLINIKSKNYYSIGYAIVDGATIDVTGLITYATPSVWIWGGTAQIGANYFFSPTWFIDMSYNYSVTGSKTIDHQQGFTNTSSISTTTYTTSGTLITTDKLSVKNQTVMFSINKLFDF